MRVVHERRRSRHAPDARTVEDLLTAQVLDFEPVDEIGGIPAAPEHEPRVFLPPPRTQEPMTAVAPREPESTWSKVAKLAGLTTATSLLIGAVVASSVMTRQRQDEPTGANLAPPRITGAAALGGFVTQGPAAPRSLAGASTSTPLSIAPSPLELAQTQAAGGPPAAVAAPSTTSAAPHTISDEAKISLVKQFYLRMIAQPENALAMLSPELAGAEPGDLVRAWSSMTDVVVDEVAVQPDGSVRAVAKMTQQDGTKLLVTQVLTVTGDEVISRAVLLSAEQL